MIFSKRLNLFGRAQHPASTAARSAVNCILLLGRVIFFRQGKAAQGAKRSRRQCCRRKRQGSAAE